MQQVFDVALWLVWPSLFPEYIVVVSAPCAFAAVVSVMRSCGLCSIAHATASTGDGSLVYRAFGVWLAVGEGGMLHS